MCLVSRAIWVAVGTDFSKPPVLSTLARLPVAFESPPTVPVHVGLLLGALVAIELFIVEEKLA